MALATVLVRSGVGGAFTSTRSLPDSWGITRYASNPVIDVDNNPNETTEQYVPAPIYLPNGDIWVYVKGLGTANRGIYAWKSADAGVTFSLQNGGTNVLTTGSGWESQWVLEPAAVYDPAADVIHLYYKGTNVANQSSGWAWGHATAPGSTPTVFTKDAGNPILTGADVVADIGGSMGGDLAISNVFKAGTTYHFFGYCLHSSAYKLIHASGTDWDDPSGIEVIRTATAEGVTVVESPAVFPLPGIGPTLYAMLYTRGGVGGGSTRSIRAATSSNLSAWSFQGVDVMAPVASSWESNWTYSGQFLRLGVEGVPLIDSQGRWRFYYSGYDGTDANSGLAYMTPTWT